MHAPTTIERPAATPVRTARRAPPAELLAALAAAFGERFTQSQAECALHGRDESHYAPQPPDAVVYGRPRPKTSRAWWRCARAMRPR